MYKALRMILFSSILNGYWMHINDLQNEEFVYLPFSYIYLDSDSTEATLYDDNSTFLLNGHFIETKKEMVFSPFSLRIIEIKENTLKVEMLYGGSENHPATYIYFMKLPQTKNTTKIHLEQNEKIVINEIYDLTKMFNCYFLQKKETYDNTKTTIDYPIFNLSNNSISYYDLTTKTILEMDINIVD